MTVRTFYGIDDFGRSTGSHLGFSDWHMVTQERVDLFAEATGDHQWIHTDVSRATAGPYGGTIAHGFLTLAMGSALIAEIFAVDGLSMMVNYGLNRARFPSPALVGSRLRAGADLVELNRGPQGAQAVVRLTVECEGADKPVCVADAVALLVP